MSKIHSFVPNFIQPIYQKIRGFRYQVEEEFKKRVTSVHPHPILVLGNQKSGTSAIAALLAENTGLSVTIDITQEVEHPIYHHVILGKLSFDEYIQRHKLYFSNAIIKEPNLTLFYNQLIDYFPQSQFVFIIRDPRDNIRSILNRLQLPGNLTEIQLEQRQMLTQAWQLIIDNFGLNLPGSNYIEKMAYRWDYMANLYSNNSEKMILIRYEDFLQDKVSQIERLAQKLGLKPINDISDKVNIQFQGRGDRNVKWQDFFEKDNLSRIESICNENMKKFDYLI
ncbi:MAG: sulfotransferase [Limnoraphis sp.]